MEHIAHIRWPRDRTMEHYNTTNRFHWVTELATKDYEYYAVCVRKGSDKQKTKTRKQNTPAVL